MRRTSKAAASFVVCAALVACVPTLQTRGADVAEHLHQAGMANRLKRAVSTGVLGNDLAVYYRYRSYRPTWITPAGTVRPEALILLSELSKADREGLNPQDYQIAALRSGLAAASGGSVNDQLKIELSLTAALGRYLGDLRSASGGAGMIYTDPSIKAPQRSSWVAEAALAPDLGAYLRDLGEMNPLYNDLRGRLAQYRAEWMGLPRTPVEAPGAETCGSRVASLRARLGLPPGCVGADLTARVRAFQEVHGLTASGQLNLATLRALNTPPEVYERVILINLDRARALPVDPGRRFILVDAASARLWLYENGVPVDSMRVIVGSREFPTPQMAGAVRYMVVDPYWNLPPDLVRERVAKKVLRDGLPALDAENMEVLSGWSDKAVQVDPATIDWPAVASGRLPLRVRQRPGPGNMMGAMKFMLPNRLGIYLHDTPDRNLFTASERTFSAGCVRLEQPARLARWLLAGARPLEPRFTGPERRVDLPSPVPIYIVYLTVSPGRDRHVFHTDVYRRDQQLLARRLGEVSAAAWTALPSRRAGRDAGRPAPWTVSGSLSTRSATRELRPSRPASASIAGAELPPAQG